MRRCSLVTGSASAANLPAADAVWLVSLLDPDQMRKTLTRGTPAIADITVTHVRYRPGASCTIAYEVLLTGDKTPVSIYARALAPGRGHPPCPDPDAAPTPPRGRLLVRPRQLAGGRVVVREFPHDATLPELTIVAEPERLARLVVETLSGKEADGAVRSTFIRLRYKAEHRLVLRADLGWDDASAGTVREARCQVRFEYGVDRAARLETREALARVLPAKGTVQIPGRETVVPQAGCSLVDWRPGRDMSRDLLLVRPEAVARAARTLATVSSLPAEAFAHLEHRTADDLLAELAVQADVLHEYPPAPDLAGRFGQVLDRLGRMQPRRRTGLVHGDFHQGQMLVDDDRISLLDWDRAHLGDPARDRGRFLAQVHLLDVRGRAGAADLTAPFRAALAEAEAPHVSSRRETFWTVYAVAGLALRELRRLRPDWLDRTTALLNRCDALLDREVRA